MTTTQPVNAATSKAKSPTTQAEHDWRFWKDPKNYDPQLPLLKVAITEWACNSSFKREFEADPKATLQKFGWQELDPLNLQILTDPNLAAEYKNSDPKTPKLVKQYRQFITAKKLHAISVRDSGPREETWATWRSRMVKATFWREGALKHARLVHAPFAIELTQGCTVGCWFCGVDAEKFQQPAELNQDTKKLYNKILAAFKAVNGEENAQHGFLYWATDPLDHPDYEWFLEQFYEQLNFWPQTTTAQGMKHAERLRTMFETIKSRNSFVQRFSMVRKHDLEKIREFFTPEELFLCEQIPQYDNEASPKATSGRTRKIALEKEKTGKKAGFKYNLEETGSIACVSGFLINLVSRSIKLITPCEATDRWPLGYRILAEGQFTSEVSAEETIQGLITRGMDTSLQPEDRINIYKGVVIDSPSETEISFSKYGIKYTIKNIKGADSLSRLLKEKDNSLTDICIRMQREGVSNIETMINLYKIRELGVINEAMH